MSFSMSPCIFIHPMTCMESLVVKPSWTMISPSISDLPYGDNLMAHDHSEPYFAGYRVTLGISWCPMAYYEDKTDSSNRLRNSSLLMEFPTFTSTVSGAGDHSTVPLRRVWNFVGDVNGLPRYYHINNRKEQVAWTIASFQKKKCADPTNAYQPLQADIRSPSLPYKALSSDKVPPYHHASRNRLPERHEWPKQTFTRLIKPERVDCGLSVRARPSDKNTPCTARADEKYLSHTKNCCVSWTMNVIKTCSEIPNFGPFTTTITWQYAATLTVGIHEWVLLSWGHAATNSMTSSDNLMTSDVVRLRRNVLTSQQAAAARRSCSYTTVRRRNGRLHYEEVRPMNMTEERKRIVPK
ncbi:hypothetical protein EDC04DRAFT_2605142 [Pisolithus marmoratus]|nr:hypothetical protein EDC04DRAFT_2605142 [Pisolithus marmoratus]